MASLPDLDLCHSCDLFLLVLLLVLLLGGRLLLTPRACAGDAAILKSLDAFVQEAVAYGDGYVPLLAHRQPDA
jgi:hypothetical protein